MKTIYQILREAPYHDTVTIRFPRPDLPGHIDEMRVTEVELRWLQLQIAKGEYPHDAVVIMDKEGHKISFAEDGRIKGPIKGYNTMSLCDDLAIDLLVERCNPRFAELTIKERHEKRHRAKRCESK